jgi:hypothetical protein
MGSDAHQNYKRITNVQKQIPGYENVQIFYGVRLSIRNIGLLIGINVTCNVLFSLVNL